MPQFPANPSAPSRSLILLAVAAIAGILVGPSGVTAASPTSPADELADLPIESEVLEGYDRDDWGSWSVGVISGDNCDTRCELLVETQREDGTWFSSYDGFESSDPADFHIDHLVSLAEVYRSGGDGWSADRRRAFFNDRDSGLLRVVSASSNLSKSDKGPSVATGRYWVPSRGAEDRSVTCEFVADWVHVKAVWGLSVDPDEHEALENLGRACGWETSVDSCQIGVPSAAFQVAAADGGEAGVWRLYQAFFLREPDDGGFAYWREQLAAGMRLEEMAGFFAGSEEFGARYDNDLSDADYVGLVYANALCRDPDGEGLDYWVERLGVGAVDRGTMMVQFSESSEYRTKTGFA